MPLVNMTYVEVSSSGEVVLSSPKGVAYFNSTIDTILAYDGNYKKDWMGVG
jgi:hypothetical protein